MLLLIRRSTNQEGVVLEYIEKGLEINPNYEEAKIDRETALKLSERIGG